MLLCIALTLGPRLSGAPLLFAVADRKGKHDKLLLLKITTQRGTWVAQLSVRLLVSAQDMISQFVSSRPALGSVPILFTIHWLKKLHGLM